MAGLDRRPLRAAAAAALVVALGLVAAVAVSRQPVIGAAAPAIALGGVVAARRPVGVVVALFVVISFYGTITAFTPLPPGGLIDLLLLVSLWASVAWSYVAGRRGEHVWLPTSLVAVGLYLAVTVAAVVLSSDIGNAILSFRISAWYLSALFAVAYAAWSRRTERRVVSGLVLVALLVGAYATFRWVVGPAGAERALAVASSQANTSHTAEGLALVGSFPSRGELGSWCAVAIPFCFSFALGAQGRWRWIAAAACTLCAVALLGAELRVGAVGVSAGAVLVLGLHLLARARAGPRVVLAVASTAALIAVGAGVYSFTVGGSEQVSASYQNIFTPGREPNIQTRLDKWRSALAEVRGHPTGLGLGTAGRIQLDHGRFTNVASDDLDSGYIKIAYEQGLPVLGLFIAAMLLLVAALARCAVTVSDMWRTTVPRGRYRRARGLSRDPQLGDVQRGRHRAVRMAGDRSGRPPLVRRAQ